MTEKCNSFTPLTGCATHNAVTVGADGNITVTCNTCAESYIKNNSTNLCEAISGKTGFITGCVTLASDSCTKCQSGQYLAEDSSNNDDKVCKGVPSWASANCST